MTEALTHEVDLLWTHDASGLVRIDERRRGKDFERKIVRHFVAGVQHGRQENRDEWDRLRFESNWKDGRPHGRWASYTANGDVFLDAEFSERRAVTVNGRECPAAIAQAAFKAQVMFPLSFFSESRTWFDVFRACRPSSSLDVRTAVRTAPPLIDSAPLEWDEPSGIRAFHIFCAATGMAVESPEGFDFLENSARPHAWGDEVSVARESLRAIEEEEKDRPLTEEELDTLCQLYRFTRGE